MPETLRLFETDEPAEQLSDFVFPLKGGREFQVTERCVDIWRNAYPTIDVDAELRKCIAWNHSNPTRRKTARGIRRHVNEWLSRANDDTKAGTTNGRKLSALDAVRAATGGRRI